jgi:exosome complex protein LRP1
MDTSEILTLLERLDDEIDDLEEAAAPLLKTTISDTASKLPLLDKAKLYVLMTYSIESLLFCRFPIDGIVVLPADFPPAYIRLHGVNARDHPVFRELTRVKQYFDKIKVAETPVVKRDLALDRQAAHRFITAGLVWIFDP